MKFIKCLPIIALAFVFSCDNDGDGSINREFYQKSDLEVTSTNSSDFNILLTEGNRLVFRYSFNHPEEQEIADDELTEVFWFTAPADQNSFSYQSTESSSVDVITTAYQRLCFCGPITHEILSYNIQGTQINQNEWRIEFSMQARDDFNTTFPLQDKGIYTVTTN